MEEERIAELIRVPEWKTLLLDLVEKNELDPWDIDIVRLTQLYLEEVRRLRDLDLYLPANIVLASSILLWLKSRILDEFRKRLEEDEGTEEAAVIEELPEPVEVVGDVVVTLPEPAQVVPPSRIVKRRVSLDELLDVMERLMRRRVSTRPVSPPPIEEFFEDVEEERDVEDYIDEVYGEIVRLADSTGMVLLSRLAPPEPMDFVRVLLAVLYLANEGKVDVMQEEAFGEVIVRLKGDGRG